ncbi:hypothetical protein FA10DRAFT_282890 [Acaromyces ingoldii]|uniref:Uncharacterized protein n=1 Tax=Acaromyces ingoldii TaxID=215250 RepID=A0A316YWS6_9BASI|nr:hypothetical protein FA10DRAFT_282890 [Acaromyces ingoldii]PWN93234.1 hypothetical protein FA10DRAFT_282890 [Acaromyces ingoldii]
MRSPASRKRDTLRLRSPTFRAPPSVTTPLQSPTPSKGSKKDWTPPKPTFSSYKPLAAQLNLDDSLPRTPSSSFFEDEGATVSRFSPWSTPSSASSTAKTGRPSTSLGTFSPDLSSFSSLSLGYSVSSESDGSTLDRDSANVDATGSPKCSDFNNESFKRQTDGSHYRIGGHYHSRTSCKKVFSSAFDEWDVDDEKEREGREELVEMQREVHPWHSPLRRMLRSPHASSISSSLPRHHRTRSDLDVAISSPTNARHSKKWSPSSARKPSASDCFDLSLLSTVPLMQDCVPVFKDYRRADTQPNSFDSLPSSLVTHHRSPSSATGGNQPDKQRALQYANLPSGWTKEPFTPNSSSSSLSPCPPRLLFRDVEHQQKSGPPPRPPRPPSLDLSQCLSPNTPRPATSLARQQQEQCRDQELGIQQRQHEQQPPTVKFCTRRPRRPLPRPLPPRRPAPQGGLPMNPTDALELAIETFLSTPSSSSSGSSSGSGSSSPSLFSSTSMASSETSLQSWPSSSSLHRHPNTSRNHLQPPMTSSSASSFSSTSSSSSTTITPSALNAQKTKGLMVALGMQTPSPLPSPNIAASCAAPRL